jgi:Phage integrase, N-terminal SAM-like domain
MATGIDERTRSDGKTAYQAHVFDKRSGKRIRKTFDNKTAAKQWRTDAMAALRAGGQPLTRATAGKPVRDSLTALLAGMRDGTVLDRSGRRYRPSTIRGYQSAANRYLIPTLGHLRVTEVRRGDVQRLVDKLGPKMTGTTIRRKLDPLRVLYRRAIEDELVEHNPTEKLRYPARKAKPRRIANTARVEELLDALPTSERAVWAMAFYGALRVGDYARSGGRTSTSPTASSAWRQRGMTSKASNRPRPRQASASSRSRADCARICARTSSRPDAAATTSCSAAPARMRSCARRSERARWPHGRRQGSSPSHRTRAATAARPTSPPPACRRRTLRRSSDTPT